MFDYHVILQYVSGPAVGAVIGYITNDIAIKMLFRPRKAYYWGPRQIRRFGRVVYLRGWKLPFTPGLIPKERRNIAKSIGDTIARELLSAEVIRNSLLSDDVKRKVESSADALLLHIKQEERSVEEVLPGGTDGAWRGGLKNAIDTAAQQLGQSLLSSGFEQVIASKVIDDLRQKLTASPVSPLRLFWDDNFSGMLSSRLTRSLTEMAQKNAPELVRGMLEKLAGDILRSKVSDLYEKYEEQIAGLRGALLTHYEALVTTQVDKLLAGLDIATVVEERINSFDMAQLEEMTFRLMKKELRAIVWLGALLGAIMGVVTSFI
ncbi:MAG: DUF445 family protein [Oscillospiraceae bacterium]|jgi:uncharacterized membrane protein YheB (UPF0754 family)|nr:DUF445 family protein [Oscillospiraceae bacterium]